MLENILLYFARPQFIVAAANSCPPDALTDIAAGDGSLRCPEAQSNIFVPSSASTRLLALRRLCFLVEEDMRLLLVCALGLDCQFGSHVGG